MGWPLAVWGRILFGVNLETVYNEFNDLRHQIVQKTIYRLKNTNKRGKIMREILELFTHPEICAEEMIRGKSSRTLAKGIINIAQIALLVALVDAVGSNAISNYLLKLFSGLKLTLPHSLVQLGDRNVGIPLIMLALSVTVIIILGAILAALIMAGLLFVIKFLVGGAATFKELFLITIFSQVVMTAVILVETIVYMIIFMTAPNTISQVILEIMMLFRYWYLVFILVGFNVANKVSLLRSILAVLFMQSLLWGAYYLIDIQFMLF